jgi:hypothetical protein
MAISSVGSVQSVPAPLRGAGSSEQTTTDSASSAAPATPPAPPAPANDGDSDDQSGASTALTRSSPQVQEALLGLQTNR